METGATIRKYRKNMKLSQTMLGNNIGVTKGTITNWENGHTVPSRADIKRLARFFNVDESELTGYESEENIKKSSNSFALANELTNQLVEMFIKGELSENDQKTIIMLLNCAFDSYEKQR